MRSLDTDTLRTFLAVHEATSFAAAGARVHKTQSTVSVQMRKLEETLGAPLFKREGRRNMLSPAGRELLDYARRIVRLNDEIIGRFRGADVSGRIRIGTPDDYAETLLPDVFGRFAVTHPAAEVVIECQPSEVLAGMIAAGDLDVAIVTMNDSYAGARMLLREPLVWVAGLDRAVELERPLPLAVWQPGCAWRTLTLAALDEAGLPYRIAYTGSNGAALAMTVRSGLAVAALPQRFVGHGLRALPIGGRLPALGSFEVGLMVAAGGGERGVVGAFAAHVKRAFAALGTSPSVAEAVAM
jgi:DNA-binding transcriptional LysR family regulator